ncbi:LytR C-terminal domain-containing protein [Streptomyces sp. NPDC059063]|uniref:LytR C-terminal domain-containing protein n=1 Tax=unclassified Streptomyces TaxID=2593676 RepID=UPI0036A5224F
MSMLTPPGMGGKYRITGDTYPRMRRPRGRRRIVLVAVASLAAAGLLGWGGYQLYDVFTGGDKASAAAGAKDCATKKPDAQTAPRAKALPEPRQITVNVYNATSRVDLAQDTADELKKRGFTIGEVDNATKEYDGKVKGTGILLGPRAAMDTALPVLGTQLAGAERRADARKGGAVDLIIGDRFKSLTKAKPAKQALAALSSPRPAPKTPADAKPC